MTSAANETREGGSTAASFIMDAQHGTFRLTVSLGMALRLAFDLALHVDMSPHVARKSLTQQEADLRQDVFWGVYVIDQYVMSYSV